MIFAPSGVLRLLISPQKLLMHMNFECEAPEAPKVYGVGKGVKRITISSQESDDKRIKMDHAPGVSQSEQDEKVGYNDILDLITDTMEPSLPSDLTEIRLDPGLGGCPTPPSACVSDDVGGELDLIHQLENLISASD